MTDTEHRDVYIAAAVGGVGLVLVLLYLFGNQAPVTTNANGTALPSIGASSAPATPYTFNVPAYDPAPGIPYPRTSLPPNTLPANNNGCCDECGPSSGGGVFNNTVAQFMTLLGYGNAGGA